MFNYSVVIPAHDEQDRVGRALASVLGQSLPPREVIVVDDGSTDGTADVVRGFSGVRLVQHATCRGLSSARNTGIEAATSEWVALLDADDLWLPSKIERQVAVLQSHAAAGLVSCGVIEHFEGGDQPDVETSAAVFRSHEALRRQLMIRNCITGSGSGVLLRRELPLAVGGFDPALKVCEDWDLWMRIASRTEFAAVPEPLVKLFKRPDSLGSVPDRMFEGEHRVLHKNAALFAGFPNGRLLRRKAEAACYVRRANGLMFRQRFAEARRDYQAALRQWPLTRRAWVPWLKLRLGWVRAPQA